MLKTDIRYIPENEMSVYCVYLFLLSVFFLQLTKKDLNRTFLVTVWGISEILCMVTDQFFRFKIFALICFTDSATANPGVAGSNLHAPRCSLYGSNCLCLE